MLLTSALGLCGLVVVGRPPVAAAAVNPWPQSVAAGFVSGDGTGVYVVLADGAVTTIGTAHNVGDASGVALNRPVVSGASAVGGGYWLVSSDGGVFGYGRAPFYGGLGGVHLNQPVFAMASNRQGSGYWLAARDGGIFAFGAARFYGSIGGLRLSEPIVGMVATPSGHGYRLVARDGGIFSFGDARYYGSLPGRGMHVADVIGMASTPTGRGYWIARAGGAVEGFGDAPTFRSYRATTDDPVAAIAANPTAVGYRLVTQLSGTMPFGNSPAGTQATAPPQHYLSQIVCRPRLVTPDDYQSVLATHGPLWDRADGGVPVDLGDGRRLWLFGDTFTGPGDDTGPFPGNHLSRNTIAIQQGNCFQFRTGGSFLPTDYLPGPAPGEYFWPMDAVVDRAAGVVRVSVIRVANAFGPNGFGFREVSNDLVTLDLHTLTYRSTSPMPNVGGVRWGTSMTEDSNWVYLYGLGVDNRYYAARTSLAHLLDGHWQYSTGTGWSTNPATRQPLQFRTAGNQPDPGTAASIDVEHYGTGYVLSGKRCEAWCDDVTAWYSSTPYGPWRAVNTDNGRIATTPMTFGQISYNGRLVLIGNTWIVVWNVNAVFGIAVTDGFGTRDAPPSNLPAPDALAHH